MVGTMENLCFYELAGKYYVRMKPGPSRKEFMHGAKYRSRKEAGERMVLSARVASKVYDLIPKDRRSRALYYLIQKEINLQLKADQSVQLVIEYLSGYLVREGYIGEARVKKILQLAHDLVLNETRIAPSKAKKVGHYHGVRIRTNEGRWVRLYHEDELELLHDYVEQMEENEAWLTDFLVKRKNLPTYRLKHRRRRRTKSGSNKLNIKASISTSLLPTSSNNRHLPYKEGTIYNVPGGMLRSASKDKPPPDVGFSLKIVA